MQDIGTYTIYTPRGSIRLENVSGAIASLHAEGLGYGIDPEVTMKGPGLEKKCNHRREAIN